jgi:hypothetical protein
MPEDVEEKKPRTRSKRPVPYVPSPAYLGENLAPEASLCLDFCIEAMRLGWDVWPEHPNRRFDMILVAREGCSTCMSDGTPVPVGTQVGVHAKVGLNHSLVKQLKREARNAKSWGIGPDYIVGLVPCAPRTPLEKRLAETLSGISSHGTVGLLFMFAQFNGHEHEETLRTELLRTTAAFGDKFTLRRRFRAPLVPTYWAAPGSSNTKMATRWKVCALKFINEIKDRGPLDYKEMKVALHKHRAGSLDLWRGAGWLTAQGHHVDPKTGRRRALYVLNINSTTRPDVVHADVAAALREHEQAQDQAQAQERPAKEEQA